MTCDMYVFGLSTISGERDHSIITECSEAKDQAALISILFHTKRLEEEYGPPSKLVTV